jgi:glycosyltransferase involved in cell wall biosynthesis
MRVLILTHSYYLRDTRPRRHANAFADAGWDVDVLCARDEGEPAAEQAGEVRIMRLPARRRRGSKFRYVYEYASFGAMAFAAMAWLHARKRYDAIYVFSIPNILVRAAAIPKMRGARVILDVRDPMPEFFMSKYHLGRDDRLVRAMLAEERAACRFADRVITVHEPMRGLLLRTGVKPDKIGVVLNAPDMRQFAVASETARDPGDRTLLFAGTVATRYGVDLVVRAVAALREEIPEIRARIVGDGDAVPMLRALAAELGVTDRVEFTGPLPLDRLPPIIQSAWIGAQPHRDDPLMHYCFSTKVLEWAALGLPVVVARTPAFERTFAEDEVLFCAPGNLEDFTEKLRAAHADPARLTEMTAKAKASVQRFDWTHERETLLELVRA